ncbi:hypothetical protein OS493_001886 [Desmophyllum pertusum]|uniref:PH domain-containing protein n=1 Tax=Desmophyllum pertusum TaxID=174260 RepID=A0A9X0CUX3_9CNID|nr:hypothetical protein OS493_001886 [Desmophyllum pertusum]
MDKVIEPFAQIGAQELLRINPSCQHGWVMYKDNARWLRKWSKLFMILHTGCLYLYKSSNDSNYCKAIPLTGYSVCDAQEVTKFAWTFKLIHGSYGGETLFFTVDSELFLENWKKAITEAKNTYCPSMSPPTLPTHCNLRRDPFNESKTTEPPRQPLASPLIPPPIRATVPGPGFPVQPPLRATVPGPHNKHQTAGPPEEFPVRPSALAPQSRPPTARLPVQPGYSVPGPHSKPQIRKPATLPRSCLERATTSASMIGRLSRSSSESSLTPNYVNVERQHEGRLISVHEGPQSRPPTTRLPVQPGYSVPAGPHSKPQIRKPAALPRPCPEPDTKSASMTRRLSRSSSESCLTTPNYVNVERQHEGRLSFVYEDSASSSRPSYKVGVSTLRKCQTLGRGAPDGQSSEEKHWEGSTKLRTSSEFILKYQQLGTYSIRLSEGGDGNRDRGYAIQPEGPWFNTIEGMLEHFTHNELPNFKGKLVYKTK